MYLSLGIWAKDLTGSNAAAGGIFLAQGVPSLLAPITGHVVDRVRRKTLLLVANAATGTAVLSLLLIHSRGQLWLMYAVAAFYGASFTLMGPASAGLLKDLLPDGATTSMLTNLSQTLSIAIGAALVDIVNYRILLLVVAAGATAAAVPVLLRPAQAPAITPPPTSEAAPQSLRR